MSRLEPTKEILRHLALKSGNQCAFPKCKHRIVDLKGNYIAQLAHIEAAEPGGPRYNSKQTDKERRSFENLMFLCYEHHKKIDTNTEKYTVEKLKNMKEEHEDKMSKLSCLNDEQIDELINNVINGENSYLCEKELELKPSCSKEFVKWLEENDYVYEEGEIEEIFCKINEMIQIISELNKGTREIVYSIIKYFDRKEKISLPSILDGLSISKKEFLHKIKILIDEKIIENNYMYSIEEQILSLDEDIKYTWENGNWVLTLKAEVLVCVYKYINSRKKFKKFMVDLNLDVLD